MNLPRGTPGLPPARGRKGPAVDLAAGAGALGFLVALVWFFLFLGGWKAVPVDKVGCTSPEGGCRGSGS